LTEIPENVKKECLRKYISRPSNCTLDAFIYVKKLLSSHEFDYTTSGFILIKQQISLIRRLVKHCRVKFRQSYKMSCIISYSQCLRKVSLMSRSAIIVANTKVWHSSRELILSFIASRRLRVPTGNKSPWWCIFTLSRKLGKIDNVTRINCESTSMKMYYTSL
jgi:hypothetical protein